jgi:uncharacterized protein
MGCAGLRVSKLCFGTLTLSPLQKNIKIDAGADLLQKAFDLGVNFFDTAELYDNYDYLKKAFKGNDDVVIATKSYSHDEKTAKNSLEKALKGLERDYIDIFLLHEQESDLTLKGHLQAIDYFLKMKQAGVIKSFGISTHFVAGVRAANDADYIDIIHPIINATGIGIIDGSVSDMLEAIVQSKQRGKGVYAMKSLGGGHLINDKENAFKFALNVPKVDSVAVGMQSEDELRYNIDVFSNKTPDDALTNRLKNENRRLFIHKDWCTKCKKCISRCEQGALTFDGKNVIVDGDQCVLCSYCSTVCSELAIKII